MRVHRLVARGFRNLAPLDVELDGSFTVLHGDNAQGKTNTLEALWYAATLRPLRGNRPAELVAWGSAGFQIAVWSERSGVEQHRVVRYGPRGRELALDGDRCTDLASWFADLRAIAFTPADGDVIAAGPEGRRRWLDRAAFTARPSHLQVVRAYRRALRHKARLLRNDALDPSLLDVLDEQLATLGAQLVARRADLLAELLPHIRQTVHVLAGRPVPLRLELRTAARGITLDERRDALHGALVEARSAELRRRRPLIGPHTDDLLVDLQGQPARRYASRGQIRTLVLALKLAELVAAHRRGAVPIFLLDDLSSELDRDRTRRLIALLEGLGAQVIATTTDPAHLVGAGRTEARWIRVHDGRLSSEG